MFTPIPAPWLADPPEILVAGDGPYASALSLILKSGRIRFDELESSPAPFPGGAYPLVLDELRIVFFAAGLHQGAADLLAAHAGLWRWVERLSTGKEEHAIALVFILPDESARIEASLALALALPEFDPATSGHAVVRMDEPLEAVLSAAAQTVPRDGVILRNRIEADRRLGALRHLREAASKNDGDPEDLIAAAEAVVETFAGREYDIDLFCRPPRHSNGNALRELLHRMVTGEVTPSCREEILTKLSLTR